MKDLVKHIEFLVNQNNCVIIPGLGGFVLNYELAHINEFGLFLPPRVTIGFNAELNHNDGLLCKSYSQHESISYDAAVSKISFEVKQLKISLQKGKKVSIGSLGSLALSDGNIVFNMNDSLIYPSVWGYSTLSLRQLDVIKAGAEIQLKVSKKVTIRRVMIAAVSTAAAITLMLAPLSGGSSLFNKVHQSGFFSDYTSNVAKKITANKIISEDNTLLLDAFAEQISQNEKESLPFADENFSSSVVKIKSNEKNIAAKNYYIIVGGDSNKAQANRILATMKKSGFSEANIVESIDRYRIYVASFTNKDEANQYLDSFRVKNPSYADAWLFAKRNK